jgi:hypothetical protein
MPQCKPASAEIFNQLKPYVKSDFPEFIIVAGVAFENIV